MKRAMAALVAVILVLPFAFAADTNSQDANDVVAAAEVLEQLRQAQNQLDQVQQAMSQPQIVTVQIDSQTQSLLKELQGEVSSLKQEVASYQEKFTRLRDEITAKMESEHDVLEGQINAHTDQKSAELFESIKEYMRYATNPVRINLPNFALWLMVTGAFMLFFYRPRGGN